MGSPFEGARPHRQALLARFQTDDSIVANNSLLGQRKRYPTGTTTELQNPLRVQALNQPEIKVQVVFITEMFEIVLIWMMVQPRHNVPSGKPVIAFL